MTTIATDGKVLVGDGLSTSNGLICSTDNVKVHRIGSELVGCAGLQDTTLAYLKWLRKKGPKPLGVEDNFNAVHVSSKGVFLICGNNLSKIEVTPPFAIGSGADHAIGAMAAGATPRQAVVIVSKLTTSTGGKITELKL